ncbi:MAG: glycine--tRNA ligase subunit beta [Terriglobales bacterium]
MPDFLLEIGCEEIPARMIEAASLDLRDRVSKLLDRERLSADKLIASFDTPRRLAVLASQILHAQPDTTEKLTGPSLKIAFKDGQPTPAAHAFAKKAGIEVSRLEKIATPKGEYVVATASKKGRSTRDVLLELLPKEITSIYWPKNMYWREPSERFVRPVRWLVAMLDGEVIPFDFFGLIAGDETRGHRILANRAVKIPRAGDAYVEVLRDAKVLNRSEREHQIRKGLDAATRTIPGARWREDKNLLDAVVNLTEFPSAILGNFEKSYLKLPEEVLVTVMRDHQKYFAVEDSNHKLLPHFLAVLNTDGDPDGIIRHGHERVLRARFNDARFFWQTDQKHPLRERAHWLTHVTFQKDLGSYYDKTRRVQRLCSWLCEIIRQSGMPVRPGVVHKAAMLAKTDLTTELVKEFTELQGIVGGLYACAQELDHGMPGSTRQAIADAVYDQYKPVSTEDSVPRTVEGAVLSIGDKADTIVGMFALGLQPTGSKDPFALRRQANGIVRIIAEHKLPIKLDQLTNDSYEAYRGSAAERKFSNQFDCAAALREFFRERVEFYLRDVRGFKYDVVNAVLAAGSGNVVDTVNRARAIAEVRDLADFQSIAAASKRIRNILRQASEKGVSAAPSFDPRYETSEEARLLSATLEEIRPRAREDIHGGNYANALRRLSALREPTDKFFDEVMVMVEDEAIRSNRLALLQSLLNNFSTIADFSEIVTEGKESTK